MAAHHPSPLFSSLNERRQYWQRRGIPSPKGNLFFGHTFQMFGTDGAAQVDIDTFNQLGNTYGYFYRANEYHRP